ncbi:MAG TPA: hypothetical protein VER32_06500 [Pyrinomonadaceae bacterium]|nr:hypothetical protein [Pyrinomonadaceae bacterium]
MPQTSVARLLDRLEELKRPSSSPRARKRLRALLRELTRRRLRDAPSLMRLHEALIFMRAYPQGPALLRATETLLKTFSRRVREAEARGADLSALGEPEVSGVAGTEFSAQFSYDVTRRLARAHPSRVDIDWDGYDERAQLAVVWPKLLPLYEEDAYVDTRAPFLEWVRAAKRRGETDLGWLMRAFDRLDLTDEARAALFDPLKIWVRLRLGDSTLTRTRARLRPPRKIFFHAEPLIERRDVSLERELASPPLPVKRLARREAERLLLVASDAMSVRFRELHGFTHADPRSVVRADAGRGAEIYAWGVRPARRLPLLAYVSMMVFKNGVPAAYAEGLTLCERSEVGFNLFYTFREGESAWLYARVLRLVRQLHGVEVFSIDPYQLGGVGNEEGLESGAFWFYRKLGFRPVAPEQAKLLEAEERRVARRRGYRTPPARLRRLASEHLLYETARAERGAWDGFRVRHVGLAVGRRMRERFDSDPARLRAASVASVERALRVSTRRWDEDERRAFENLSLPLALVPDLARWTRDEKQSLLRLARAKAGRDEISYARLLNRHPRLRRALLELGTASR